MFCNHPIPKFDNSRNIFVGRATLFTSNPNKLLFYEPFKFYVTYTHTIHVVTIYIHTLYTLLLEYLELVII